MHLYYVCRRRSGVDLHTLLAYYKQLLHGLSPPLTCSDFARSTLVTALLVVSHVCGLWCSLAISIIRLWPPLCIQLSRRCPATELLELCLYRSGNYPLSIYLEHTELQGSNDPGAMVWNLNILAAFMLALAY